ncbi:hypothetical protein [Chroococcidiopsis thermalis]|uniref:hypothetical protein n=1 Tax=Chroococcidiopsis thermalis TaxID=54299 RepID=UPI0002D4CB04|nr:hypothetical protein [Chroococcidiopsis thermalis]
MTSYQLSVKKGSGRKRAEGVEEAQGCAREQELSTNNQQLPITNYQLPITS